MIKYRSFSLSTLGIFNLSWADEKFCNQLYSCLIVISLCFRKTTWIIECYWLRIPCCAWQWMIKVSHYTFF